ncbi:hypothetical protein P20495_1806 [Pseudoalteromonas sp. BSi20495]|nr:hypothetical protein P20495_1806 [Pseudoalteromonas sp. BSi20495]
MTFYLRLKFKLAPIKKPLIEVAHNNWNVQLLGVTLGSGFIYLISID